MSQDQAVLRKVLKVLNAKIAEKGETAKSLSLAMGRNGTYVGQVLSGRQRLSEESFFEILDTLGVDSVDFWLAVEGSRSLGPVTPEDVRELIRHQLDARFGPPPERSAGDEGDDEGEILTHSERVLRELGRVVRESQMSPRELSRALGHGDTYLAQVFSGVIRLRMEVLIAVLRFCHVWPSDFYARMYPRPTPPSRLPKGEIVPGLAFDEFETMLKAELIRSRERVEEQLRREAEERRPETAASPQPEAADEVPPEELPSSGRDQGV